LELKLNRKNSAVFILLFPLSSSKNYTQQILFSQKIYLAVESRFMNRRFASIEKT